MQGAKYGEGLSPTPWPARLDLDDHHQVAPSHCNTSLSADTKFALPHDTVPQALSGNLAPEVQANMKDQQVYRLSSDLPMTKILLSRSTDSHGRPYCLRSWLTQIAFRSDFSVPLEGQRNDKHEQLLHEAKQGYMIWEVLKVSLQCCSTPIPMRKSS